MSAWPTGPPPWIMGILNVTPDSFSDGGRYLDPAQAISHARQMIDEGADIIDVGGESTRPGAMPIDAAEQLRRTAPVIETIREFWHGPISIDTTKSVVALAALGAGATWVNDVSALRDDPELAELAAEKRCPVVLMHMLGAPRTMQKDPVYDDVLAEVIEFLHERAHLAERHGIKRQNIIIDPGIGFGKRLEHNLALLRGLPEIAKMGYPILVGASRKSFISQLTSAPVGQRAGGSLAAAVLAVERGAKIVRVHDVGATKQALTVALAVLGPH